MINLIHSIGFMIILLPVCQRNITVSIRIPPLTFLKEKKPSCVVLLQRLRQCHMPCKSVENNRPDFNKSRATNNIARKSPMTLLGSSTKLQHDDRMSKEGVTGLSQGTKRRHAGLRPSGTAQCWLYSLGGRCCC